MTQETQMICFEYGQTGMTDEDFIALANLLISVVDGGASIGFLSPIGLDEAEEYWRHALQQGVILWAIKCDGRIAGTVQLHLSLKDNGLHRAEVCKLMVDSNYRRMGFGKQLMEAVETKAIELGRTLLILDTREGDPSNLLYKQMGYMEAGIIPRYAKSSSGTMDGTVIYYKELTRL